MSDLEEDSYEQDFETFAKLKLVELSHPAVQLGFERLGRLLQLKRKPLDSIEDEILEGKYRANESIKIVQL